MGRARLPETSLYYLARFVLASEKDSPHLEKHDHPTWEHIAILKGAGKIKLGELELDVAPGALFQIPPRARHAFTGSGREELVAIQLYTPSGPEQRFVMLANQGDQR